MDFSVRLGLCPAADAERLRRHLAAVGLPTDVPTPNGRRLGAAALLAHMRKDKKSRGGHITLILARRLGEAFATGDVAEAKLAAFLEEAVKGPIAALQN